MGMDMRSGNIRELSSVSELKEGEVLFQVGEKLEVKGCSFKIKEIYGQPFNQIVLEGISKLEKEFEPETFEPETFEHLNRHERRKLKALQ